MSNQSILYFKTSAVKYSKGDIEELLEKELKCAGPLLTAVLNGIDNLSGMCYDFKSPVGVRFAKVLADKMNISEAIANVLYKTVRCGVVHQGMPKIGVVFYLDYERKDKGKIVRKHDGYIWLNVTEFAYCYLDTIDQIEKEPAKYIHYIPPLSARSEDVFENAYNEICDTMGELMVDLSNKEDAYWEEKVKSGEREHMPSKSAYYPDGVFALRREIPPQN